ncbi:MAG TPA: sigma-70 family RNA polymerase sigma factor [Acidimicrobiia bacterium]|nr:sigma-70 family RNA polymerase sigma factor [Acidimicrobiia bacterium]
MTDRISQDRELIRRYLEGDVDAFDELMRANEDRVFAICLRMMKDRDAALDATQDVFLTVFRKADRYKEQAAFSTWLYRVAVNTCYDHLRRLKRQRTESMPGHLDPSDPKGGDEFNAVELRPDIQTALAGLTQEFRAAVVLVDLDGMSLESAADVLDVPIGTVKSRVFRARRQLAKELGNLAPGSEHLREES